MNMLLFERRFSRSPYLALPLLFLIASSVLVFGQSDAGRIVGRVTDQNGAVVPGATITVRNDRTSEERTGTSTDDGTFIVAPLKASTYTVTVAANSLSAKATGVQLLVGQELNLQLTVVPNGVEAKVDISAGGDQALETGSASMSANVNPREVEGLPINGRQLSQLYLQAPGSVNSGAGTFGDIRFNGRANQQNVIRYDGIEGTAIIDASPGNINGEVPSPFRLQSSLENVQEFRVESSNFPAEFGTGTGGQVSVVTKSGGNQFHGSLFEYLRNSSLDAANFFDNILGQKAPLRLNQFGGSIGGPIIKDKFFFFGSYEGYRLRSGINNIEAVPGSASRICAPPVGTGTTNCAAAILPLLPTFTAPNAHIISFGTGTNLFDVAQLQASNRVNEDSFAARFDYKFSNTNSMYFRYFRDQGNNIQPEGVTGRNVVIRDVPQNGIVAVQSILKPTLINEAKFGYNAALSRINGAPPTFPGVDLSNIAVNISGNTANFSLPGQGSGAGTAVPGGLVRANSATNGRGQPYTPFSMSAVDTVNWTNGNHNFKFGGEIRWIRMYTDRQGGTTYTYSNLTSFLSNSPASIQFLGDVSAPSPFNNGATGNRQTRQTYYVTYAQDEWKLRPNLTLNYGLRYEYYTPLTEAHNLDVIFDISNGTLKPPTTQFYHSKKSNFGPRVALSWSPNLNSESFFGGGHTVIRGGFGIYYGPGQTEDQLQPVESDRISSTFTSNPIFTGGPALAYPLNTAQAATFFVNNPTNRQFQPRAYSNDYTVPERVFQYSVSYEQQLPYQMAFTAAYVGSQGRNLFLRGVANLLLPGQTTIADGTNLPTGVGVINRTDASGRVIGVTQVRQFDLLSGATIQKPFAEIDFKTSGGHDSYNALQLTLARRLSNGLTLNSQYTFSKSFGDTTGSNEARTAAVPNNFEADLGYNNFDVRHTFNLSALYALPYGKGRTHDLGSVGNAIFGDWEIGGIANARSGLPIEVGITRNDVVMQCTNAAAGCTAGEVRNLPGTINAANPLPAGFTAVINTPGGGASRNIRRPDLISGVSPYLNNDRNLLNPAAFATPAPGTFGNLARNALRGPNFKQFDLIFNKRFRLTEAANLQFRTEIFNVFNATNFANPAAQLNNSLGVGANTVQPGQPYTAGAAGGTFGLLRSTVERAVGLGTNRQIQFALRLSF